MYGYGVTLLANEEEVGTDIITRAIHKYIYWEMMTTTMLNVKTIMKRKRVRKETKNPSPNERINSNVVFVRCTIFEMEEGIIVTVTSKNNYEVSTVVQ